MSELRDKIWKLCEENRENYIVTEVRIMEARYFQYIRQENGKVYGTAVASFQKIEYFKEPEVIDSLPKKEYHLARVWEAIYLQEKPLLLTKDLEEYNNFKAQNKIYGVMENAGWYYPKILGKEVEIEYVDRPVFYGWRAVYGN